jgi:hypothetical protein
MDGEINTNSDRVDWIKSTSELQGRERTISGIAKKEIFKIQYLSY